jgi:hypothetical protein
MELYKDTAWKAASLKPEKQMEERPNPDIWEIIYDRGRWT